MTTKITLFEDDVKESLLKLTTQKQIGAYGHMEETLLTAIKKQLADNDIAITMNTAYFLSCKFFETSQIAKWDKTRYSELAKYSTLKTILNSNKVKIEQMSR